MFQKLGSLFVEVSAKGVEGVNAQLQGTEQKATLASKATQLFVAAITMIGSYAIIQGIRNIITEFTNYTNAIDKANKTTGVTVENLQRLKYATDQEHASFEMLTKGLTQLSRRMSYARDGLETYTRVFKRLGVAYQDEYGNLRNVEDVFYDVTTAIEKLPNDTERSALAMELFGRSGAEMVPFLKLGSEKLHDLGNEAERLGLVLNQQTINAGKEFDDNLVKLKGSVEGLKLTIGEALIPTLNEAATSFKDLKPILDVIRAYGNMNAKIREIRQSEELWIENLLGIKRATKEVTGATIDLTDVLDGTLGLINRANELLDENKKYIKADTDAIERMHEAWRTNYDLNIQLEEVSRLYMQSLRDQSEAIEELDELQLALANRQLEAGRAANYAAESFNVENQFLSGLGNAFRGFNISLISNAKAFHQWAQNAAVAIGMVIVKLLALTAIIKILEMLGVPAGSLLKAMDTLGLYQTPQGDMSAYREGRDFGKFFMQGFGERVNNRIGGLIDNINTGRQQTQHVIVHTGDPSTYVEFVSKLPQTYKSKLYRDVTLKGQRTE